MMFIWGQPLEAKEAANIFDITKEDAYELFKQLQKEYEDEGRGIVIRK
jgi:segregation and condensation protein B